MNKDQQLTLMRAVTSDITDALPLTAVELKDDDAGAPFIHVCNDTIGNGFDYFLTDGSWAYTSSADRTRSSPTVALGDTLPHSAMVVLVAYNMCVANSLIIGVEGTSDAFPEPITVGAGAQFAEGLGFLTNVSYGGAYTGEDATHVFALTLVDDLNRRYDEWAASKGLPPTEHITAATSAEDAARILAAQSARARNGRSVGKRLLSVLRRL